MAWGYRTGSFVANAGGNSPLSSALAAAVSAGDRIVVGVVVWKNGGTPTTPTVSDNLNAGNYTEITPAETFSDGTFQVRVSLFTKGNSAAGTPTITVTSSGSTGGFVAAAYSGLSTTDPGTDKTAGNASTSGGTASSGATAATTAANELVLGFYGDDGWAVAGLAAGTGFTSRGSASNANFDALLEDQDSGVSGSTPNAGLTSGKPGGSVTWGMVTAVFQLAGGGGGTTPSSSDSATLTDTVSNIGLNGPSDASSVGEANKIGLGSSDAATLAEQNAIALLNSDSAAFAEQVAIAAPTSASDTATLAETIKIALTATDSAQLGEAMALALAHQDAATLQELVSVALAIADAASLSESASVTQNGGNTPSSNDSGTLGETTSSTAAVSASDIGALAEQAAIALKVTDLASMTEQIGLGLIGADSAALIEQLQVAVAAAATDSSALADVQTAVNAALSVAQAATLGESATVQIFSGGVRDWVYVIFAPIAKWGVQPAIGKWSAAAPQQ